MILLIVGMICFAGAGLLMWAIVRAGDDPEDDR